jgi:tRNA-Thr(GGU) m(6)t(6)A37 methyltransferase TsaA
MTDPITLRPIGTIHTPYDESFAPHQPVEREEGTSTLVLEPDLAPALSDLEGFRYIYVVSYLDGQTGPPRNRVKPPWAKGREVGLFASRSPARPNPIGLSIVRLVKIEGNVVTTSLLDLHDGTPLLDIKPYIRDLDSKHDADTGWIADLEGGDHALEHARGVPHDHDHHHGHGHDHDH